MSAFFSLHRPISVTSSVPAAAAPTAFDAIFATRARSVKPAQVLATLSSAVDALEAAAEPEPAYEDGAADNDGRLAVSSVSVSNTTGDGTHHLDGAPQSSSPLQFPSHLLSGRYKPFTPPAAPVPTNVAVPSDGSQQLQQAAMPSATLRKSYSTILTILESTHPNGSKTYTARTSPMVADDEEAPSSYAEHDGGSSSLTHRQPASFLARMRLRQQRWQAHLRLRHPRGAMREPARGLSMHLISVKRQRKLKMKKHKYKKLMRKTRNLRRKLDRN